MKSRFRESMEAKLSIRNLYKIFGDSPDEALRLLNAGRTKEEILAETGNTVGVQDVNFEIEQGKIFVVMGLSGSGKSTLVRMLNGLIPPTSGDILIDGDDVAKASDEEIRSDPPREDRHGLPAFRAVSRTRASSTTSPSA